MITGGLGKVGGREGGGVFSRCNLQFLCSSEALGMELYNNASR